MPIQQYYVLPYDRWEGFEAERQRVLSELQGVKNVIFLSTDVHATLINDARFQTLESGGPQEQRDLRRDRRSGGHREPRARDRRRDRLAQHGRARRQRLLHPSAAGGVGMRCSVIDQFSYGQVKVTASA